MARNESSMKRQYRVALVKNGVVVKTQGPYESIGTCKGIITAAKKYTHDPDLIIQYSDPIWIDLEN